MNNLKEQRITVKFCVKLRNFATESFTMLKTAYDDIAMKRIFMWHERFTGDQQSIDDDEHPGRPSTSTDDPQIDKINTLVRASRRLTIRELAEESEGRHPMQKARTVEKS